MNGTLVRLTKFLIKASKLEFVDVLELVKSLFALAGDENLRTSQAKLLYSCLLKEPKQKSETAQQLYESAMTSGSLSTQLYALKALIVRGETPGYQGLMALITNELQKPQANLPSQFGLIICKTVKPEGLKTFNKLWAQRLFTMLYPVLLANQDKPQGVSLLMQCCNLVPISQLQSKIVELIPTAKKAIVAETDPRVKLKCLTLFRKIIGQPELRADYVAEFMPILIKVLEDRSKSENSDF